MMLHDHISFAIKAVAISMIAVAVTMSNLAQQAQVLGQAEWTWIGKLGEYGVLAGIVAFMLWASYERERSARNIAEIQSKYSSEREKAVRDEVMMREKSLNDRIAYLEGVIHTKLFEAIALVEKNVMSCHDFRAKALHKIEDITSDKH